MVVISAMVTRHSWLYSPKGKGPNSHASHSSVAQLLLVIQICQALRRWLLICLPDWSRFDFECHLHV
jgi:hypothetical protein